MKANIQAVIFDWAGTIVDFGCFAPLYVFVEIFKKRGIEITLDQAREPMGMLKIDHVRAILQMKPVTELWKEKFGKTWEESDVNAIYDDFVPALMETLAEYTDVLEGVIDTCDWLRNRDIKIGSTTGYTKEMMKVVAREAKSKGYSPDMIVTAEDVDGRGRPYPYMIFENMSRLGVYPPKAVVKVGDTISDIKEGLNAGVWSVGVIVGSNVMGLTEKEYEKLSKEEKKSVCIKTEKVFLDAGADYVIKDMKDLPKLIDKINKKIEKEKKHELKRDSR